MATYRYPLLNALHALEQLKRAAKSFPGLAAGVTIAVTAAANLQGMGEAKSNWNSLAKALEVEYPGLIGNAVFLSRAGWIADDREAWLNATVEFQGAMQKLSGVCYSMENQVDEVRDRYYLYWVQIGVLTGFALSYLAACQALKMSSRLGATAAEALQKRIEALLNVMIANLTKVLYGFIAFAATTLASVGQSLHQLFSIQPTGKAAVNFQQAVISTNPPSQYIAPKKDVATTAETEPADDETPTPGR